MLTPTAVDFCCARATSACTAWVSGVMETAGGAGVCAKAGRPRRRRRIPPPRTLITPALFSRPLRTPLTGRRGRNARSLNRDPSWLQILLEPLHNLHRRPHTVWRLAKAVPFIREDHGFHGHAPLL